MEKLNDRNWTANINVCAELIVFTVKDGNFKELNFNYEKSGDHTILHIPIYDSIAFPINQRNMNRLTEAIENYKQGYNVEIHSVTCQPYVEKIMLRVDFS